MVSRAGDGHDRWDCIGTLRQPGGEDYSGGRRLITGEPDGRWVTSLRFGLPYEAATHYSNIQPGLRKQRWPRPGVSD